MIAARTGRSDLRVQVGIVGLRLFDERAAGGPLPDRTRAAGRRCRAYPSADRRAGAQYQRAGRLQSRLEARRRAAAVRRLRCSRPTRRSAGRSPPACWGSRPGCSKRRAPTAACGAAATPSSSTSAIPDRASRSAAPPAIVRPMRRCKGPPASRRGCSTCSRARTGRCSPIDAPSTRSAPRPGLRIHRIGERGDIVDERATSATPTGWRRRVRAGAAGRLYRRRRPRPQTADRSKPI